MQRSGSTFGRRLGYYLIGLSIGFVMLGVLWSIRARVAASQGTPAEPPPAPSNAGR